MTPATRSSLFPAVCLPTVFLPAVFLATLTLGLLTVGAAVAETPPAASEPPKPPEVQLVGLEVTPKDPGPDTLCQLTVKLRNTGERDASLFAFRVTVNGHELPVYAKELFAKALPAGQELELRLFNFWSSETGRPMPEDGSLTVDVELVEAQWITISKDKDGAEVWDPVGTVEGLPSAQRVVLGKDPK